MTVIKGDKIVKTVIAITNIIVNHRMLLFLLVNSINPQKFYCVVVNLY